MLTNLYFFKKYKDNNFVSKNHRELALNFRNCRGAKQSEETRNNFFFKLYRFLLSGSVQKLGKNTI